MGFASGALAKEFGRKLVGNPRRIGGGLGDHTDVRLRRVIRPVQGRSPNTGSQSVNFHGREASPTKQEQ